MAQTRVGFIGAGAVAHRHAAMLGGFPDVELAGVTGGDSGGAEVLARAVGTAAYPDVEALLDGAAPDAVFVCVPPFAHGAPERALLEAGVPFFVEKPLAVGLEVAEEIAAGVAEGGLITSTGYHWRYLEGMQRARDLLADTPARLVTGAWLDKVPPPAWWVHRAKSGGQIVEQATHLLDCMLDLVGDVDRVFAVGRRDAREGLGGADVDDSTAAVLLFARGAVGSLTATSLLRGKARASVELACEGRRIEISETRFVVDEGDGPVAHEDPGDAKRLVDRAFIDVVQGRPGAVRAPYEVALRTHRVGCAIAESALRRMPVDLGAAA